LVKAAKGSSRQTSAEIGWGGAKVFSGIVLDEYNPDLKGKLGLQTAEKMGRTSGQVRAVERVTAEPGLGFEPAAVWRGWMFWRNTSSTQLEAGV
jgi:hypothetical protein